MGGHDSGDTLNIHPNITDSYPYIKMEGDGGTYIYLKSGAASNCLYISDDLRGSIVNIYALGGTPHTSYIRGGAGAGDTLTLKATAANTRPTLSLVGGGDIEYDSDDEHIFKKDGSQILKVNDDGSNTSRVYGMDSTGKNLNLYGTSKDTNAKIIIQGSGGIYAYLASGTGNGFFITQKSGSLNPQILKVHSQYGGTDKVQMDIGSTRAPNAIISNTHGDINVNVGDGYYFYLKENNIQTFSFRDVAGNYSEMRGGPNTGDVLDIRANTTDTYPWIRMIGAGNMFIFNPGNNLYLSSNVIVQGSFSGFNISSASDVTLTSLTSSQSLVWDGSTWKNSLVSGQSAGNLSDLTIDVDKDWNSNGVYNMSFISSAIISGGSYNEAGLTSVLDSVYAPSGVSGGSGQNYAYSYLIYKDGSDYKLQDGGDGTLLSSNTNFANVMAYCMTLASADGGSDIYIKEGNYLMSGEFFIPDNTTLRGAGMGTKIAGQKMTNSEIVVSGSYIKVQDFMITGSIRVSCRNYNYNDWHDITYENIHARDITTSGHRGTFEGGYWGHMTHTGHNVGVFMNYILYAYATNPPIQIPGGSGGVIHDIRYLNCSVISSTSHGFTLRSKSCPLSGGHFYNVWYDNCLAQGAGMLGNPVNYGIGFSPNEATTYVENVYYNNCTARNIWRSGFHQESSPITKNINVIGCLVEDVGMKCDTLDVSGLTAGSDAKSYAKGIWCHSGTTVRDCKVIRPRAEGIYGNGTIENNMIFGYLHPGDEDSNHSTNYGIYCYGSETKPDTAGRVKIRNNRIEDTTKHGIYVTWCSGAIIEGNTLINNCVSTSATNSRMALQVNSNIGGSIVSDNYIKPHASCNIAISIGASQYGKNVVVKNNYITRARNNGINFNSPNCIIDGNTILSGCTIYAGSIQCGTKTKNSTIINNKIFDTPGVGILARGQGTIVANNTLTRTGSDCAIMVNYNHPDMKIVDNYISGANKTGIYVCPGCDRSIIKGNSIYGTVAGYPIVIYPTGCLITDNVIYSSQTYCGIITYGKNNYFTNNVISHTKNRGIYLSGYMNVLDGNNIYDYDSSKIMTYAIQELATNNQGYHTIKNNYLSSNNSTPLLLTSTTNTIRYNTGYITENHGCDSVSDGGTIAHGCSAKPTYVNISPSGTTPIAYSYTVDSSDITVYHTSGGSIDVSWEVMV